MGREALPFESTHIDAGHTVGVAIDPISKPFAALVVEWHAIAAGHGEWIARVDCGTSWQDRMRECQPAVVR